MLFRFILFSQLLSLIITQNESSQVLRKQSPADPCLLKCKDDYMLGSTETTHSHIPVVPSWRMDSAIGSPLHALVETAGNERALERIGTECSHHSKFLTCLGHCKASAARQILVGGQETLKTICESFKSDPEFGPFVLSCLARNGARVGRTCQLHWSLLEKDMFETMQNRAEMTSDGPENEERERNLADGIKQLCRGLNSYADCHLKTVAQLCHRRALPFFVRLNAKSSSSLLRMLLDWAGFDLQTKAKEWPECSQWDLSANGAATHSSILRQFSILFCFILFFLLTIKM